MAMFGTKIFTMSSKSILVFFILWVGLIPAIVARDSVDSGSDTIDTQHYIDAVDNYIRGLNTQDLDLILSLYSDSATVEDPVGSKVIAGEPAVRQFYTGAVTYKLNLTRTGPVRIAGNEVAFPFQLRMDVDGQPMITDIIDVFRFNKSGKIVSMRAFWGPSNQEPARE